MRSKASQKKQCRLLQARMTAVNWRREHYAKFSDLPPELRNEIYAYYFANEGGEDEMLVSASSKFRMAPLAQVNRQLRMEYLSFACSRATLAVDTGKPEQVDTARALINLLPQQAVQHLRAIKFTGLAFAHTHLTVHLLEGARLEWEDDYDIPLTHEYYERRTHVLVRHWHYKFRREDVPMHAAHLMKLFDIMASSGNKRSYWEALLIYMLLINFALCLPLAFCVWRYVIWSSGGVFWGVVRGLGTLLTAVVMALGASRFDGSYLIDLIGQ